MASLASGMALVNGKITVDIVESNEFPHLSQRYSIRGVPTTVIDDAAQVVGAVPPGHFLDQIREYLASKETPGDLPASL